MNFCYIFTIFCAIIILALIFVGSIEAFVGGRGCTAKTGHKELNETKENFNTIVESYGHIDEKLLRKRRQTTDERFNNFQKYSENKALGDNVNGVYDEEDYEEGQVNGLRQLRAKDKREPFRGQPSLSRYKALQDLWDQTNFGNDASVVPFTNDERPCQGCENGEKGKGKKVNPDIAKYTYREREYEKHTLSNNGGSANDFAKNGKFRQNVNQKYRIRDQNIITPFNKYTQLEDNFNINQNFHHQPSEQENGPFNNRDFLENSVSNSRYSSKSYNDQIENNKNNLSHEANYKLSKMKQDAGENNKNFLGNWCKFKKSAAFDPKTSSHLMKKEFEPSRPSYGLEEIRRELIENLLKRREQELFKKRNKYDLDQQFDEKLLNRNQRLAEIKNWNSRRKRLLDNAKLMGEKKGRSIKTKENKQAFKKREKNIETEEISRKKLYRSDKSHAKNHSDDSIKALKLQEENNCVKQLNNSKCQTFEKVLEALKNLQDVVNNNPEKAPNSKPLEIETNKVQIKSKNALCRRNRFPNEEKNSLNNDQSKSDQSKSDLRPNADNPKIKHKEMDTNHFQIEGTKSYHQRKRFKDNQANSLKDAKGRKNPRELESTLYKPLKLLKRVKRYRPIKALSLNINKRTQSPQALKFNIPKQFQIIKAFSNTKFHPKILNNRNRKKRSCIEKLGMQYETKTKYNFEKQNRGKFRKSSVEKSSLAIEDNFKSLKKRRSKRETLGGNEINEKALKAFNKSELFVKRGSSIENEDKALKASNKREIVESKESLNVEPFKSKETSQIFEKADNLLVKFFKNVWKNTLELLQSIKIFFKNFISKESFPKENKNDTTTLIGNYEALIENPKENSNLIKSHNIRNISVIPLEFQPITSSTLALINGSSQKLSLLREQFKKLFILDTNAEDSHKLVVQEIPNKREKRFENQMILHKLSSGKSSLGNSLSGTVKMLQTKIKKNGPNETNLDGNLKHELRSDKNIKATKEISSDKKSYKSFLNKACIDKLSSAVKPFTESHEQKSVELSKSFQTENLGYAKTLSSAKKSSIESDIRANNQKSSYYSEQKGLDKSLDKSFPVEKINYTAKLNSDKNSLLRNEKVPNNIIKILEKIILKEYILLFKSFFSEEAENENTDDLKEIESNFLSETSHSHENLKQKLKTESNLQKLESLDSPQKRSIKQNVNKDFNNVELNEVNLFNSLRRSLRPRRSKRSVNFQFKENRLKSNMTKHRIRKRSLDYFDDVYKPKYQQKVLDNEGNFQSNMGSDIYSTKEGPQYENSIPITDKKDLKLQNLKQNLYSLVHNFENSDNLKEKDPKLNNFDPMKFDYLRFPESDPKPKSRKENQNSNYREHNFDKSKSPKASYKSSLNAAKSKSKYDQWRENYNEKRSLKSGMKSNKNSKNTKPQALQSPRSIEDLKNFDSNYNFEDNNFDNPPLRNWFNYFGSSNTSSPDLTTESMQQENEKPTIVIKPDKLSLSLSNDILNCTALQNLQDFLKSLPKNITEGIWTDHNKPPQSENLTTERIDVEFSTQDLNDIPRFELPNIDETTMENDMADSTPINYSEITESDREISTENIDMPTEEDFDESTTESIFELPISDSTTSFGDIEDVKLNINIKANVRGNTKTKKFYGNGTINVLPDFSDDRLRRETFLPPFEEFGKRRYRQRPRESFNLPKDGNEDINSLASGKLSANVVKSILNAVQEDPELKPLWPSLKHNQLREKSAQQNLYAIRNQENENSVEQSEKLLQKAMASINDIIEEQIRSRDCLPLRPDLQEFYDLILRTREEQEKCRGKREMKTETKKNGN